MVEGSLIAESRYLAPTLVEPAKHFPYNIFHFSFYIWINQNLTAPAAGKPYRSLRIALSTPRDSSVLP